MKHDAIKQTSDILEEERPLRSVEWEDFGIASDLDVCWRRNHEESQKSDKHQSFDGNP